MLQNEYITTTTPRRSILDRSFGVDRINMELVLYALLFVLSIGLHLSRLDVMAMHHDESIHAWMSYKFFNGMGPFTCAGTTTGADGQAIARQSATYCYDPVYHGPSLYVLTLLSYFLFGVGEAQARLPMALAGIGLVPMAWTMRGLIGRKASLLAAVLMTVSPSILYYTRFARHDALVLLWSMFMIVGLFKFLKQGGAANLALATAGLALTWATHELVFILIFIGGSFLLFRLLWEWRARVFFITCGAALAFSLVFMAAYFGISQQQSAGLYAFTHRLFGPVLMLAAGVVLTVPMALTWDRYPIVSERFATTWQHERRTIWIALATFLTIFALLFTTFFAYPLGFFDGWYQGIAYWLGSQHEFARGGQPWFYYLMLLPIYDLLAIVFALTGVVWLLSSGLRRRSAPVVEVIDAGRHTRLAEDGNGADGNGVDEPAPATIVPSTFARPPLMVYFFGYWFIQALIGFSWAGEKMPWLLTHISLPATLLAAWVVAKLIERVPWRTLHEDFGWTVPLLTLILVTCVGVAAYAFSGADETVQGIQARLRGLIPLVFAGLCMYGLLTIAGSFGGRVVARLAALTVAAVLLLYGVRAMTLVVYRWPDTPVEPLVYTQTSPDVPILVRQIKQLSINQSRNERSADDPTGGLSMPIAMDGGASQNGGEGSLAWPMQWYLRDYKNVRWIDVDTNPTINPDTGVVVLYKPHLTAEMESQLEADFVKTSEGIFNWWFPEFNGSADPNQPDSAPVRGYKSLGGEGPWAVISWPFRPSNWSTLAKYMIYRTVPQELNGREMVVYMHRDVAPGGGQAIQVPTETLTAETSLAQGQFNNARGLTSDSQGNLYIADASNHRIVVLNAAGEQIRAIGSLGRAEGQLHEPSGVAVDEQGNIYVADTWNGRVVKFGPDGQYLRAWGTTETPFGEPFVDPASQQTIQRYATDTEGAPDANAQNPLGFFGPRNVLVSGDRVYITDTGNSRVVVTDLDGNFVQQFGSRGAEAGQMREPIGLGVDQQGLIYVGDTWNGRIQIFQPAGDGLIDPVPVQTIAVSGWAANTYNDPYIAVAADGRIWASQGARNTVAQFDANRQYIRRIKAEPALSGPKGLTLGPDNKLYLLNSGANEILRFQTP